MKLDNGQRDRQITLQVLTTGKDAAAAKTESYADAGTDPTPWAKVTPVNGREMVAAGHKMSEDVRKFITLYRTDIGVKDRIVFEGKNFDIVRVETLGRYEETCFTAKAVN